MAPSRHPRRFRKITRKSPMELPDFDCQASLQLLRSDIDSTPLLPPPSPSACTTTSSESPSSIVTHLPFAPGSSHTRNRKEGHIPRPPNAFMVFRSWLWNNENLRNVVRDNRNVSRIAGCFWNELSEAQRGPFRFLAEEAKARHAQLYPEYKYSPGSQKKPKASQRRSQRSIDLENEKCKKIADLLLGGVTTRDLAKYLGDELRKVKPQEPDAFLPVSEQPSSGSHSTASRIAFQRPALPREESPPQPKSNTLEILPAPLISTPPSQYAVPLPIFPVTEESPEMTPTPAVLARTPELVYPAGHVQEFVATADIPHLSLDGCNDLTAEKYSDDDLTTLFPSHLSPGSHSIFSGVKPEATSFVDSYVLGAHTTDMMDLPNPLPFTELDIDFYPSLVPLGSPVFSNPFEPSISTVNHSTLLDTLDQLFGQPISPLSPIFPNEI